MKKIIIIEDDQAIKEVINLILHDQGYQVHSAISHEWTTITSTICSQHPDLILMDLWFNEIRSDTFIKKLKKDPKTKSIPIIILSASDDLEKIAEESQADGYLAKPFDIDDLLSIVKKHII